MSATRDNNLTLKHKRGLELIALSLMKKYKFINGWSLAPDWERWATTIYMNFNVNQDKLDKYYGKTHDQYYDVKFEKGEEVPSSILFALFKNSGFDTPERQSQLDESYNIKRDMEKFLNLLYKNLPEDMIIKWDGETGREFQCEIKIDEFFFNRNE